MTKLIVSFLYFAKAPKCFQTPSNNTFVITLCYSFYEYPYLWSHLLYLLFPVCKSALKRCVSNYTFLFLKPFSI